MVAVCVLVIKHKGYGRVIYYIDTFYYIGGQWSLFDGCRDKFLIFIISESNEQIICLFLAIRTAEYKAQFGNSGFPGIIPLAHGRGEGNTPYIILYFLHFALVYILIPVGNHIGPCIFCYYSGMCIDVVGISV